VINVLIFRSHHPITLGKNVTLVLQSGHTGATGGSHVTIHEYLHRSEK